MAVPLKGFLSMAFARPFLTLAAPRAQIDHFQIRRVPDRCGFIVLFAEDSGFGFDGSWQIKQQNGLLKEGAQFFVEIKAILLLILYTSISFLL